jgi:hypothetical protein
MPRKPAVGQSWPVAHREGADGGHHSNPLQKEPVPMKILLITAALAIGVVALATAAPPTRRPVPLTPPSWQRPSWNPLGDPSPPHKHETRPDPWDFSTGNPFVWPPKD